MKRLIWKTTADLVSTLVFLVNIYFIFTECSYVLTCLLYGSGNANGLVLAILQIPVLKMFLSLNHYWMWLKPLQVKPHRRKLGHWGSCRKVMFRSFLFPILPLSDMKRAPLCTDHSDVLSALPKGPKAKGH